MENEVMQAVNDIEYHKRIAENAEELAKTHYDTIVKMREAIMDLAEILMNSESIDITKHLTDEQIKMFDLEKFSNIKKFFSIVAENHPGNVCDKIDEGEAQNYIDDTGEGWEEALESGTFLDSDTVVERFWEDLRATYSQRDLLEDYLEYDDELVERMAESVTSGCYYMFNSDTFLEY